MRKNAFTLTEILVVIVILGLLATLAIPRMARQQEVSRLAEAVSGIQMYYGAQQRYALDHGAWSANCANLDVSVVGRYFQFFCNVGGSVVASSQSGEYSIAFDGANFTCTNIVGTPCDYLARYLP